MRKSLLALALLGGCTIPMQAQFQLTNSDFEGKWPKCIPWNGQGNTTKAGTQPEGWIVSNVVAQVGLPVGVTVSTKETRDNQGSYVKLTNNENSGNRIPAYLSLGTTWATAKVSVGLGSITVSEADGGTWGGIKFSKHPDAISFDYQRDNSNDPERASVIAYLWKGTYTQKDVPTTTAKNVKTVSEMLNRDRQVLNKSFKGTQGGDRSKSTNAALIASAEHYITESTNGNWVNNCVVELNYGDYTNKEVTPDMFNIIFSANDYFADRSSIVKGNSLSVDNVKLLYYHSLSDITYGGKSISKTSDASDTDYTLTVNGKFDASKIGYKKKGQGATVTPEAVDQNTYKLVVKAEDYDAVSNPDAQTTYTIHIVEQIDYKNDLVVAVTSSGTTSYTAPQPTTIQLVKESDGSKTFKLRNFVLGSGEDALGIGNIEVTNLTENGNTYTASKNITITAGDDPSIEGWFGPNLGEMPVEVTANIKGDQMIASIHIDMTQSFISQDINVTFAPTTKISDDATLTTTEGLANIVMTRTFKKGWNTICLPFAADVEALGATKAQAFQSSENGALNFASISDKSLSANVPYLVFFENESDNPFIYGGNVEVTAPKAQTFGGYTFTGNYQAGFSMNGLYGVADKDGVQRIMSGGEGATLGPCRAYFQTSKAGANGMLISFDGQITGITSAELNAEGAAEDAPIYNLQGVRVNHLTKGVYIKGGKKIIVK